jgi:hypothetical protein
MLKAGSEFFSFQTFNKDNRLTPREFRSSAGVRVLRFDF